MKNPYLPPASDTEIKEVISKTRWKVFFWVVLLLQIFSTALGIFDETESAAFLVLDVTAYAFVLLGLLGYAFDKRILSRRFWKPFISLVMIYDIYFIFFIEPWSFESPEEMYIVIAVFAIFSPLIFFQYLALIRYAFRANEIWKPERLRRLQ